MVGARSLHPVHSPCGSCQSSIYRHGPTQGGQAIRRQTHSESRRKVAGEHRRHAQAQEGLVKWLHLPGILRTLRRVPVYHTEYPLPMDGHCEYHPTPSKSCRVARILHLIMTFTRLSQWTKSTASTSSRPASTISGAVRRKENACRSV